MKTKHTTKNRFINLCSLFCSIALSLFVLQLNAQPTEDEILQGIDDGVVWLVAQQNGDGSWGASERVANTGFALTKLCDYAYERGYDSPFDSDYGYYTNVEDGFDFLFSMAQEPSGGPGIFMLEGTNLHHQTYNAAAALMALSAAQTPDLVIDYSSNALVDGLTFLELVEETVEFFEWGQNDNLPADNYFGGWGYSANYGWSDNSHTGYVVLGLRYAEALGAAIPQTLKDNLTVWVDEIQNDGNGGSGYEVPTNWVNSLKTGNLLFEMAFYGDDFLAARVQAALGYIEAHWNDPPTGSSYDTGWKNHIQAMFCLMKGFESYNIDLINDGTGDIDWFQVLATDLLAMQNPDGSWNSGYWGTNLLNTCWALFVLEKVVPNTPPVAVCQNVSVFTDENCLGYASAEDFDGGSYDADDDPITLSIDPIGPYPLGTTTVTLTVMDESGDTDQCEATITVTDQTAPVVVAISDPIVMWPPNHKYQTFELSDFILSVSDNCSDIEVDDAYFKSVSSDELEEAKGNGDGKTFNDIVLTDDCKSLKLRKERDGNGNGRVYTIYLGVDDGNGNFTEAICHVTVPHNQGYDAVNDDAVYWEFTPCDDYDKSAFIVGNQKDEEYSLVNYPNPFNGKTKIAFTIYETDIATLRVYDALGKVIAVIFDREAQAGNEYIVDFDANNLPKGIYFYQLQSGKINVVKKMLNSY